MTGRANPDDFSITLADERQLAWREYGTTDGPVVLYFHGTPGSRQEFTPAQELATTRGLRVIVPDRPGYGASSPRPGRSIADIAEDVAALLDHLELERVGALGFSGGGPHALACALRIPDRINRLGLVSSLAPFSDADTSDMPESLQSFWKLAGSDSQVFAAMLNEGLAAAGGTYELLMAGAPAEDRAVFTNELAETYSASLGEGLRPGLDGMVTDARALATAWGIRPAKPDCPARLWHGTRDLNAPIAMGHWLSTRLGNAPLTEWEGAAHFALFQRWEEILDSYPKTADS